MGKADLRAAIRARRAAAHQPRADLVERVLSHIPAGSVVCCYVALPGEPPTGDVIEALLARGDAVFLPVAAPNGALGWVSAARARPWQAWGVPGSPDCTVTRTQLPEVDVVIVPALAVTEQGLRLGQGGGYYDRFLPQHPHARTVALVWADELVDDVFAQAHDVGVDAWVVTDG